MKSNPLRDFFYFQKSDRRAIVAIGFVAVFCVGVMFVMDRPSSQPSPSMKEEIMTSVGQLRTGRTNSLIEGEIFQEQHEAALHAFDPNTIDSLTFVGFGLEPWKVKNFLHYRAAGKVFRSVDDLGDTYGWTEKDVERLAPYVRVGEQYQKKTAEARARDVRAEDESLARSRQISSLHFELKKFQNLTKVDVNEADTTLLRRIPGVGEKISEAIVRYRQQLGGFYSVEQLLEVKIVSPELLEWFTVSSPPSVRTININKASFQKLNSHPYITYEQTKALLQYVRLYGEIQSEQQLLSTGIFNSGELERLKPYIAYE